MNPKARKLLLQQILEAGNALACQRPDDHHFTCNLLRDARVPGGVLDAYWDGLFEDPGCPHRLALNDTAANCLDDLGYGRLPLPEMRDVQLLMLAWFHEMVRSGEFESFLP